MPCAKKVVAYSIGDNVSIRIIGNFLESAGMNNTNNFEHIGLRVSR